jgi:hypothetical protein
VCKKIFGISATSDIPYSFYGCKEYTTDKRKGDEIMLDDFIRLLLRALIESFPIDETEKADILRSIAGQENSSSPYTEGIPWDNAQKDSQTQY